MHKLTAFVIMVVVAVVALGFYKVSARPKTPEGVVLRSYEYLRRGDLGRLESCYTEAAWSVMGGAVPPPGDRQANRNIKQYMNGLGEVHVTSTVIRGTTADVEALVHRDGEAMREQFRLVQVRGTWYID